jgi:MFS family permease
MKRLDSGYTRLLLASASWFGAWGIQMVMFQWLVVEGLQQPATRVGAAQMAVTLPSLLFLLLGGATADRIDPRRLLVGVHVLAALSVAGLCALVMTETLGYVHLLVYGFAIGTFQAFGLPARDTQLSDVIRGGMSRGVAGATMIQHASQVCGAFLAGTASWLGAVPVLGFQALLLLAGVPPVWRLPGRRDGPVVHARLSLGEIGAGFVEVVKSPVLRPVLILAISTGLFFVGPFLVIIPLMVRDVYAGGAAEMGILTGMFPLGAVLGGAVILLRGGIERNGLALASGQLLSVASIAAISIGLPFAGTALAVLVWGIAGALFINAGRTLFQQHASERNRARVLSVYTLGIMGGGPIGSLASGFLAGPLGLHGTLAFDAAVSATIILAVCVGTRLLSLRCARRAFGGGVGCVGMSSSRPLAPA